MEKEDIIEESTTNREEFIKKVESSAKKYLENKDYYNSAVCFKLFADLILKIAGKKELAIYNYEFAANLFKAVDKMEEAEICCKKVKELQKKNK